MIYLDFLLRFAVTFVFSGDILYRKTGFRNKNVEMKTRLTAIFITHCLDHREYINSH